MIFVGKLEGGCIVATWVTGISKRSQLGSGRDCVLKNFLSMKKSPRCRAAANHTAEHGKS
jgi:hypothetical protein